MYIKPFDGPRASEHAYAAHNHFINQVNAERFPDDPPIPLAETIADWQTIPPMFAVNSWGVWHDDESALVAFGDSWFKLTEDNRHLIWFSIDVLPAYRRQGLARQLLDRLVNVAVREQRRLIEMRTYENVPTGAAFLRRLDAKMCRAEHINQLKLCDLRRDLVSQWIERAAERASDFELLTLEGRYPDEILIAFNELHHVMNTMPRDALDIEDWQTTPEQVRDFEQNLFARGNERWTMLARHKPSGELAGFTETVWNPSRPEILEQWGTGVLPQYRNHGLGRWLKAAMIDKVLRERPRINRIRTGNADSNAPMLKINYELGFKPHQASETWQVETEKVLRYLKSAP
jgi:GNAT superfamily N-acetyltransferase